MTEQEGTKLPMTHDLLPPFELIVKEARSMIREREAMLRGDKDTIARKVLSAVFLVRCLNLADAAIDAAKCSHGEVLALVARSCWELAFIVRRMARDEEFAVEYNSMCVKARANHLRKLIQYIGQHPDEDKDFSADLKNTLHELEKAAAKAQHNVLESAKVAGYERIYRRQYAFLSADAHHSTLALELYLEDDPGGGHVSGPVSNGLVREVPQVGNGSMVRIN
jgi:hypothetical protein